MTKILFFATFIFLINASLSTVSLAEEKASNSLSNQEKSIEKDQTLDAELSELIEQHQLTGAPTSNLYISTIESPIAQLGMKLFYSKSLGGDKTTACASCHHPMLGGGDNLSLSIGVAANKPNELGSNRQTINLKHTEVPRNAPTTFNVAFWKRILFHDGRIERLENNEITTPDMTYPESDLLAGESLVQAQARFPITSSDEMRGDYLSASLNQTLRRALAKRLQENWLEEFQKGFVQPNAIASELITEQNYSEALAAFERSQVLINTPWKDYVKGNKKALSDTAKKGAKLFFTSQKNGGAGCSSCHSGDFFTDEKTHNTAMPQIGAGKANGNTKTNDYGHELTSKLPSDRFKFRTPTLINVEMTGPWGHSGAYTSLEAVTKHMLSPINSAKNYDQTQLVQKNISLKDEKANTLETLEYDVHPKAKPNASEDDLNHLVSFLKSLTDPCTKDRECMSQWIPEASDNDPDGLMLHAIEAGSGKLL